MKGEFLETDVLINSVKLKTLGQLFIVLGEGLIGLSSILAHEEDRNRYRGHDEDRYLSDRYSPVS